MNSVNNILYDKAEKCCRIACRIFESDMIEDDNIIATAGELMHLDSSVINKMAENIQEYD